MDFLVHFCLSLTIPLLGFSALGWSQRLFPKQPTELHLAIAMFMAIGWLVLSAILLCFTALLTPIFIYITYGFGLGIFIWLGKKPQNPKVFWPIVLLLLPLFMLTLRPLLKYINFSSSFCCMPHLIFFGPPVSWPRIPSTRAHFYSRLRPTGAAAFSRKTPC